MTEEHDERPRVWTGHLGPYHVPDIDAAISFYETLGCRLVAHPGGFAIFELRGGTHVIFQTGEAEPGARSPFDLMVDDLDTTRQVYADAGLDPSEIKSGRIHRSFTIVDPGGRTLIVNDSHVVGPV